MDELNEEKIMDLTIQDNLSEEQNNDNINQSHDNDGGISSANTENVLVEEKKVDTNTVDASEVDNKEPATNNQEAINDGNKYDISKYANPFELLLAIMEDKKVDLKTIQLSLITDEYLKRIQNANYIDLEEASEFISIAATLLEIKMRNFFPKEIEEEDEQDPEKELLRRIEEYKIMKEAWESMRPIEDVDRFYKAPDEKVNDFRYVLKQMNMDNLVLALTKMMIKMQQKTNSIFERKIHKDRFTVADKMASIKNFMIEQQKVLFSDLFDDDYSKSEIITTFQALLELMKIQFIKTSQNDNYDDITVWVNPDYQELPEINFGEVAKEYAEDAGENIE